VGNKSKRQENSPTWAFGVYENEYLLNLSVTQPDATSKVKRYWNLRILFNNRKWFGEALFVPLWHRIFTALFFAQKLDKKIATTYSKYILTTNEGR